MLRYIFLLPSVKSAAVFQYTLSGYQAA